MTPQEAKFILQAYRPGHQDANDPQFSEALAFVTQDPELSVWFKECSQLDGRISESIQGIPVPSDLRDNILAGQRVIRTEPWWRRKDLLSLAAAVAILVTIVGVWFPLQSSKSVDGFRHDMQVYLDQELTRLELYSHDLDQLRDFMGRQQGHAQWVAPAGMADLPTIGCRVLNWKDERVTLVCFRAGEGETVHLMVIHRDALPSTSETPEFVKEGQWMTATWARDNFTYTAFAKAGGISLASLL